jgi:hemolysin D
MNATTPVDEATAAKIPSKPPVMRRDDQEFLPAALEILERPASPVGLSLLVTICALAVAGLVWAWFGWVDIVAVARGKIQPTGRVKTVQPLEVGKVRAIRAANGDRVREGDVLVELDPDEALADVRAFTAALASSRAEALRRREVVRAVSAGTFAVARIAWPQEVPETVRTREEAVQRADLALISAQIRTNEWQRQQKEAEIARLENTIKAQEALIAPLEERVELRRSLVKTEAGTRTSLIDALESYQYQLTVLAGQRGQLDEAKAALAGLAAEREKLLGTFLAENTTKAVEAERQADDAAPKLEKASVRAARMTLRSPTSGTVQASNLTSLGQVLTTGQEVMRVVPDDATLEVEVYLENKDIGFVAPGDVATVKVEAFPFTRYGVVEATVVRVARDAIPEPDVRQAEADPTRPVDNRTPGAGQRVASLVYPVTLAMKQTSVTADGKTVPLSAGMAVVAEIKTGQRRLLEYLLTPLVEVTSEAMRER